MLEMAIASLSRVLAGVDALEEFLTKDLPERLQSQTRRVMLFGSATRRKYSSPSGLMSGELFKNILPRQLR